MKIAVLSDIHGNLPALLAVLEDCTRQHADRFWLLGDYVDYGVSSRETVKLLEQLEPEYAIAGNHDACLYLPSVRSSQTPHGKQAFSYTKALVEKGYRSRCVFLAGTDCRTSDDISEKAKNHAGTSNVSDPYWGKFLPEDPCRGGFFLIWKRGMSACFLSGIPIKVFFLLKTAEES